ncbi:MAG: FkbM family methyltransferase, partial [Candidatus Aminicenantes bacterium]|nr:FkbM family methyltransferase [Candidatus Aminicenantes bacterium]
MEKIKFLLHDMVSRFLRFIFSGKIVHKKIKGSSMRLYYEKSQHLTFFLHKTIQYEKNIQKKLSEVLKEGYLIFDLGANIGQQALFFSKAVGDSGKVVSVEPEINNYAYLQFNSNLNGCSNIFCLNIGIGKEKGERILYSDSITGGRKSSFFVDETGRNYRGKSRLVPVLAYDDLVREFGSPQFVKIDVEGAETDILEGI